MVRSIKKQQSKLRVCSEKKLKSRSRKSSKRVSTLNNVSSRKKKQMGGRLKNFVGVSKAWGQDIKKWFEVGAVTIPIGRNYREGRFGSFSLFSKNYKFKFHVTFDKLFTKDALEVTIKLFSQKDDDNLSPLESQKDDDNLIKHQMKKIASYTINHDKVPLKKNQEVPFEPFKSKEEEDKIKKLLKKDLGIGLDSQESSPKAKELLEQLQSCLNIVSQSWNKGTLRKLKLGDYESPILFWYWEKYWDKSNENKVTITVPQSWEYIWDRNLGEDTKFDFKIVKISRKKKKLNLDNEETKLYLVNKQDNFYKGAEIFSGTSLANFVHDWNEVNEEPRRSDFMWVRQHGLHPIQKIKELIGVDLDEVTSGSPEQMLKDQLFKVIDFTETKPIEISNENIEIYIPDPNMEELETGEVPHGEPSNEDSQPSILLTGGPDNESPAEAVVPTLLEPAPSTVQTSPESDPPLVE